MREQHPIDELFARALRDAEEAPPARVWAGVVREREGAHLLLRLRRKWVWPALLLLLGGGAYWAATAVQGPSADRRAMAHGDPPAMVAASAATEPAAGPFGAALGDDAATPGGTEGPDAIKPATGAAQARHAGTPAIPTSGTEAPAATAHGTAAIMAVPAPGGPGNGTVPRAQEGPATAFARPSAMQDTGLHGPAEGGLTFPEPGGRAPEMGRTAPGRLRPLAPRPTLQPLPMETRPAPLRAPGSHRHAWWIAATAGTYRETRTWHGGDQALAHALQATETPHYTIGLGMLAGMEWRGGWNVATGLEHSASRYDFKQIDHLSGRRDSLITHVVTFNSSVIGSYTDTLTTYTETTRTVAAMNRYTSLRIPVEVGWHRAWRRWHGGVRAGLSTEFNAMRSGITSVQGTAQGVDVGATEVHKAVLLGGSLALDAGYAINGRLGLWASPGYATGLFSLSPPNGSPRASGDRWGIRLRLAYTLCPKP